ncbi:hypothetical protein NPIL_555331 [Nephila pilipes]|uniref:Uncharacterized protein n=1 Tax=Nephila pilipes TaxID=299642 RepID=A0A8X6P8B2_NEPPI|nr:hypothetical protein NPIL_555331 [Nephila pilipes]
MRIKLASRKYHTYKKRHSLKQIPKFHKIPLFWNRNQRGISPECFSQSPTKSSPTEHGKTDNSYFPGQQTWLPSGRRTKRLITRALYFEENTVISELAMRVRR